MRKLKRVAWFCFAGCCCAALMLVGGERSQTKLDASDSTAYSGSVTYCPSIYYGQLGGVYMYGAYAQGANCAMPQMYLVTSSTLEELGNCPDCPSPIVTTSHPIRIDQTELSPVPLPDPLFSGVLR